MDVLQIQKIGSHYFHRRLDKGMFWRLDERSVYMSGSWASHINWLQQNFSVTNIKTHASVWAFMETWYIYFGASATGSTPSQLVFDSARYR